MASDQWTEAMEALEDLPVHERTTPVVTAMRMRCCQAQGMWEVGETLAHLLMEGDAAGRRAAGRFLHALSVHHAQAGRIDLALNAFAKAAKAWPRHRQTMLRDPNLEALWR